MAPKEWSIGIFGIIQDGEGRILVSRRADGQGWDLSGGSVDREKDHNFLDTLQREVLEETNLSAHGEFICIGAYPDFEKKDVMILYFVPRFTGKVASSDEAVEHRFVDFATLKREIQLVWQEYPGHEHGRFWEMLKDGFEFLGHRAALQ